jgi:hypothetical protein
MTSPHTSKATLTGLAAGLFFLAAFPLSSPPPTVSAGGAAAVTFYRAHGTTQHLSDACWMLGLALLVMFMGALRTRLREVPAAEGLATTALAGAAITAAGGCVYFGCDFALASMPASMAPAAAQAINLLALQLILPLGAGVLVLGFVGGLAILRSGLLPAWTGWAAMVLGLTGMAGPFSLVAIGLWAAVVGILVARRPVAAIPDGATNRQAPAAA